MEQEEFELIPMSPLRRLEKRIEQVESSSSTDTRGFLKEVLDIVRMNQQLVDELAKANDALRIELSKLPGRLEELINDLHELLSFIKASATEELTTASPTNLQPLVEKLDQMIEGNKKIVESNQNLLSAIEDVDKKLRKPPMPMLLPFKKPMQQQPRPITL